LTLGELIERVAGRFAAAPLFYGHGTDNARDEAAWLVLRGLAGVPFYVDERVIVPRSHIAELLTERWLAKRPVTRVLDLCTGSGCLAVLAARIFPNALVDAIDLAPAALAVARKNVVRHRLARRVRLQRSDLFAALRGATYDLILTNPPYVSAAAMAALPPEYRHEPRLALAGGKDGLDLVARILAAAPSHLAAGGLLVCEVGDRKSAADRRFARLRLQWPKPEVFIYEPPRTTGASRTRATRP
jgi:ribosomal protein L3 glutamine methyltransferase